MLMGRLILKLYGFWVSLLVLNSLMVSNISKVEICIIQKIGLITTRFSLRRWNRWTSSSLTYCNFALLLSLTISVTYDHIIAVMVIGANWGIFSIIKFLYVAQINQWIASFLQIKRRLFIILNHWVIAICNFWVWYQVGETSRGVAKHWELLDWVFLLVFLRTARVWSRGFRICFR